MTPEEMQKLDAEEAARIQAVPFGDEGLKQWREQLQGAIGMRELARLLLAGVDPDEAYRRAKAAEQEQTIAPTTINDAKPEANPLSSKKPAKD